MISPAPSMRRPMVGLPDDPGRRRDDLNHVSLLQTILVFNVAILIGYGP